MRQEPPSWSVPVGPYFGIRAVAESVDGVLSQASLQVTGDDVIAWQAGVGTDQPVTEGAWSFCRAASRSRCGMTVYFGSFALAIPASKTPKRVSSEPAAS